jgi:hypothetical protein
MNTKKWYQSKTIWGIVIAFLGYILSNSLQVPDVNLPADANYDLMAQAVKSIHEAKGNLSVIIGQVMGLIGTIVAIIGRIKADTTID